MSVDLKTLTPDASLPTTGFVFGADSQASASPSVYTTAAVATAVGLQFPAGAQATPSISTTGDNDTGLWFPAANTVAASTGGLERMRIGSNGNVGIGTSSPGVKLDVSNLADTETSIRVSGYGFNLATLGTSGFGGTFSLARGGDGVETVRIRSNADSFFNGGNVGIGRSPTTRLDVYTAVASDTYIRTANTAATSGFDFGVSGGGEGFLYNRNNTAVIFGTNSQERMRITSAGNVGIGGTPGGFKLDVQSNTSALARFYQTAAGQNTDVYLNNVGSANNFLISRRSNGESWFYNSGADPFLFYTNALERMRITSAGNILIGTDLSPTTGTQCLTVETGTAPTATPADTISVYSSDLSAGNTILSIYTEGTSVNANTTAAATHRIAVRINGTVYYLLANTAA